MLELFLAGGWIMYPLGFLSIFGLGIIFERYFVLKKIRLDKRVMSDILQLLLKTTSLSEKEEKRLKNNVWWFDFYNKIRACKKTNEVKVILGIQQDSLRKELEKNVYMLGTIAVISPLLGILGTVVGMIFTFSSLTGVVVDSSLMANGISQALITTAMGLIIAIPATFFHKYYQNKIYNSLTEFDAFCQMILESFE